MVILYAILGSILASWICACASRYDTDDQSLWSICPFCSHRLPFYQMIPIFSWLKQKGKCFWCGSNIPVYTWAAEILGASGFLIISIFYEGKELFGMLIVFSALLYASLCDFLYGLIPDRTHVFILLGSYFIVPFSQRISQICFSAALFIVLFFISFVSEGIGMGDVKLISAMAVMLSPYECLCMMSIASTSALIVAIFHKHVKLKDSIRFGPYLSLAAMIVLFFM